MDDLDKYYEIDFIIWNSTLGISDFVSISEIKKENEELLIWLDEPYDFVGPLKLKQLLKNDELQFEACVVMTEEYWEKNKNELLIQSYVKQQHTFKEFQEELKRRNKNKSQHHSNQEIQYREILCLPLQGILNTTQIKSAYKKIAKTEHPDMGGSHENFIQITEAKEALLLICE
jgi:curved DNA-binding protein CbpA